MRENYQLFVVSLLSLAMAATASWAEQIQEVVYGYGWGETAEEAEAAADADAAQQVEDYDQTYEPMGMTNIGTEELDSSVDCYEDPEFPEYNYCEAYVEVQVTYEGEYVEEEEEEEEFVDEEFADGEFDEDEFWEYIEWLLEQILEELADDDEGNTEPLESHCCTFQFVKGPPSDIQCFLTNNGNDCTEDSPIPGLKACNGIVTTEQIYEIVDKCEFNESDDTCVPNGGLLKVQVDVGTLECPDKPNANGVCACEFKKKPLEPGQDPMFIEIKKCIGAPCAAP